MNIIHRRYKITTEDEHNLNKSTKHKGRSLIIISLYLNFHLPSQVDWEVYDVD
jgi:hypothetical protein